MNWELRIVESLHAGVLNIKMTEYIHSQFRIRHFISFYVR